MEELDYCGAMGAGLIEVYKEKKRPDFKIYIDKVANHMMYKQDRLADGTFVRKTPHEMTLWADDLYMSISFLARMGDLSGEQKYFDDAAKQVINFTKYLYNPSSGLYYHCWFSDLQENGVAYWGRCNGWVMLAQAELLKFLPHDHPQREKLLSIFRQQVIGNSRYQSESGLWHQVLDKNDSYLETSCTAMFTYSIAKAVNMGWIDKRYASIAKQGWEGIKTNVRADGQVENICIGTGIRNDIGYYYKRPVELNDIHGLGAVLMAGVEVLKMN
jgi:rhamnogalacturonyl hydrolase YesR